jgi:ABC-type bacteriocin/lantibiotic exporter with double-glycine peptidase domain
MPGKPLIVAATMAVLLSEGCYHPSYQLDLYNGAERLADGPNFEHQRLRTDCGVAAVAMILRMHGQQIGYATLRREVRLSGDGLSLAEIRDLMRENNLAARGVKLDLSQLDTATLPLIAWLPTRHVVVLETLTSDSAVVSDPGRGRWKVSRASLSRAWDGTALVPNENATPPGVARGRSDTARTHPTRGFHP